LIYNAIGDDKKVLTYAEQSLEISQEIGDKSGEGTTLNNISLIYNTRGDDKTALTYLERSLEIMQEIGDKSGLCATLFNIGYIHLQNNEKPKAMQKFLEAYLIAKEIDFVQILNALERLSKQLGIENNLEGWEKLAQDYKNNSKNNE
jgi:tetratricopeptide (TPR) repeat protein